MRARLADDRCWLARRWRSRRLDQHWRRGTRHDERQRGREGRLDQHRRCGGGTKSATGGAAGGTTATGGATGSTGGAKGGSGGASSIPSGPAVAFSRRVRLWQESDWRARLCRVPRDQFERHGHGILPRRRQCGQPHRGFRPRRYVNLQSAVSVKSNLTIAGQTAPGDGIGVMAA